MVLDRAGDEVVTRAEHPSQCKVVAFRAPAGKDDLGGTAPEQASDLIAGALDGRPSPLAVEVDRGRIAELLGKPWMHGREHLRRERRGGVGVHVDTMHRYLQFTLTLESGRHGVRHALP